MPAYLIVDVDVKDPAAYEAYRQKVPAIIAAHQGRYLARGGKVELLEGNWTPKRCVVLEFPSLEHARAFYMDPAYQPLKDIRERAATSTIVAVEGI